MQASFHVEGCEDLLPSHAMPAAVRVCGKLAVLDSVLSKLLAAKHKVCQGHSPSAPPSHHRHTHGAAALASVNLMRGKAGRIEAHGCQRRQER